MNEWMNGRMNAWTNEWTNELMNCQLGNRAKRGLLKSFVNLSNLAECLPA